MRNIYTTYAYHSALKAISSFIQSFPESEALQRDLWTVAGNRYSAALNNIFVYIMPHILVHLAYACVYSVFILIVYIAHYMLV